MEEVEPCHSQSLNSDDGDGLPSPNANVERVVVESKDELEERIEDELELPETQSHVSSRKTL